MKVYHKYFNLTDRFNKKMAAYGMGMPKCKRRYQRQLYIGWEIVAVARNVAVLFSCLWPDGSAPAREEGFRPRPVAAISECSGTLRTRL